MEVCEFCSKEFITKYTLYTHQKTSKKCINNRKNEIKTDFNCDGCKQTFSRKFAIERHYKICKQYNQLLINQIETKNEQEKDSFLKKIKKLQEENDYFSNRLKTIQENHETEIKVLKIEYKKHIEQLEKQNENMNAIIKSTLSESVNKPTITNNTQHISFRQCLSKDPTLDQLNDNAIIERLRMSMTEKMFFGGLRCMARLCYDCIVKLKSGTMIVCCTDISRGKFKMYDIHGNIKEDIEARYFTDKIGKCIRVAADDIYHCIVESIQDEQSTLTETDSKRKEELLDKYKRTCDAYIEIINVNDPERNMEFINELAALTSVNAITTPLEPNTNPQKKLV